MTSSTHSNVMQGPWTIYVCPECGWTDLNRYDHDEVRCGGRCAKEWRLANGRTGEGFYRRYGRKRAEREGISGITMVGDSANYPVCVPVEVIPCRS